MDKAVEAITKDQLIDCGGGTVAVRYPGASAQTVLSVQQDGRIETRPIEAIGAWETAEITPAGHLLYRPNGGDGPSFLVPGANLL